MREIIAVCRSTKKERDRVARVLDRYFWRIGDRTWRGKATNACLDRVSRELRSKAKRNTAVVVHEIRSARESRVPIVRIGARHAFSQDGIAPVSFRPSQKAPKGRPSASRSVVRIAALFHDLGKATVLFRNKLRCALNGAPPEGDPVRHELHSAAVWDHLFGRTDDADLPAALANLTPDQIDVACDVVRGMLAATANCPKELPFAFVEREGSLSHAIGMLILTHHKLPEGDSDLLTPLAERHVRPSVSFDGMMELSITPGTPFWHEEWWANALKREAAALQPGVPLLGLDVYLRAALMMGDHLGSSQKKPSDRVPDHLANTIKDPESGAIRPADSLSKHVQRVYAAARHGVDLFERYADRFPALAESEMPADIAFPAPPAIERFRWQEEAARAARCMCERNEGGFFACITAGTGTGKTRGAPTILAGAALGDARPERRYFRMSLALGLRVLATQSADEYVADLGFGEHDVSVLVGQAPLTFSQGDEQTDEDASGSESLIEVPDWLKVEMATGGVPEAGDPREEDWLRSLSLDTERGLPAFCDRILEAAGARALSGRRLLTPPVMVGTIDHLMGVAAPVNSRYLLQSLRVATSDLILDEIDQFEGEDLAAIGRLVYQAAAAGRRVIIMSATLTEDIGRALYTAYREGWSHYAASHRMSDHINLLVTGDASGSCRTNADGQSFSDIFVSSRATTLKALRDAPAARRAKILPPCDSWDDLLGQINDSCHRLHDTNNVQIGEFCVSFGMVRMTRIAHTAALAAQLHTGLLNGRLRVTLCLHSQFPRLHRSWIEMRLKKALTRKGRDPNRGLRALCEDAGVFERARDAGATSIEIVLITSPVIETGNDLDFDWAILDPISTRSIIQAAGRICRHRPASALSANVHILGRSPIAMQYGGLSLPGVETKPHEDTGVSKQSLSGFERRLFSDLAGEADFSVVNAIPMIDYTLSFPLRDTEAVLREGFISADIDAADQPLGRYIRRPAARMTQRMPRARKFRRTDTRTILFQLRGDTFEGAIWHRDLAYGTRQSTLQPVNSEKFFVRELEGCRLLRNYTTSGWNALAPARDPDPQDVARLMQIEIPDYGRDLEPMITYTEFTGFTRGSPEDLFSPFGKRE